MEWEVLGQRLRKDWSLGGKVMKSAWITRKKKKDEAIWILEKRHPPEHRKPGHPRRKKTTPCWHLQELFPTKPQQEIHSGKPLQHQPTISCRAQWCLQWYSSNWQSLASTRSPSSFFPYLRSLQPLTSWAGKPKACRTPSKRANGGSYTLCLKYHHLQIRLNNYFLKCSFYPLIFIKVAW